VQIEILNAVVGNTYQVDITIDGALDGAYSYVALGGDTVNDIAQEVADAISLGSAKVKGTAAGAVVTVIRTDDLAYDDFFTDVSNSTVPGDLDTIWADATTITVDIYGQPNNLTAGEEKHELIPGLENISVNRKGFTDRLVVAGYRFVFVHPTYADGNYRVLIGPCILEEGL
jgi:hypothetical protein